MKKDTSGVRFGAICLGIAVCVVGARCARAQNALGDGQALDRNLRQGSGGRNTPVRDLGATIRFNNAVVTGNAVGGRAFRGNVGYRATDDFRAATGTDALYQFRRDATTSAVVAAGIRGTDALQYQFALSTGQAPPAGLGSVVDLSAGLARGGNPIHRPDIASSPARPITGGGTAAGALRSTAEFNAQQALRPAVLGYRQDRNGNVTLLTASPLTGVNWTSNGATPSVSADGVEKADIPGGLSGLETVPSSIANPMGLVESITSKRLDTRVEPPAQVLQQFMQSYEDARTRAPGARDGAKPEERRPTTVNQPLQPVPGTANPNPDAAAPGTPQPPPNPPAPEWAQELDRIRKGLSGTPVPDDGTRAPKPPKTPDGNNSGNRPDPSKKPDLRELIEPETGRINVDVLRALQATQPVVTTLKPDAPTREADTYAAHMNKGEALLSGARYYDAEDSFMRAMALQPKDPLASVGRINSQLGAGSFLSAAANLRALFAEQPQMIGTRYASALLPAASTMDMRLQQLRMTIKDPTSGMGKEAGMLLAYLGHQKSDKAMVQEGLDAMAAKTYPDQTSDVLLLGLLQKIWVEGGRVDEKPDEQK